MERFDKMNWRDHLHTLLDSQQLKFLIKQIISLNLSEINQKFSNKNRYNNNKIFKNVYIQLEELENDKLE